MTDTAVFRRLDLFAGLDESALRRAVRELDALVVPAGDEFDIAQTGALCGVVGGGRLALAFIAEEDRERTIGMLEEGDVIVRPTDGWANVGPRVRCFAIEDALMHLVDRDRLDAWLHDPALAANVVRVLSAQIADRELAVAIALEPRVERRLRFWPAAAISSLVFAAAHADAYLIWPRAIALVGTGLALAWLYRWRGYWASVIAHATVNAVASIALVASS